MTNEEIVQKVNDYWAKRGVKANARIEHSIVKRNGTKHHMCQVVTDGFLRVPREGNITRLYGEDGEIKLRKIKNICV